MVFYNILQIQDEGDKEVQIHEFYKKLSKKKVRKKKFCGKEEKYKK
jgi:hypothetical protein